MTSILGGRAAARPRPAWASAAIAALAFALPASAAEVLPLGEALRRALAADPVAAASEARVAAAEANVRQAGVRQNPVIGADLENFASTGGLLDRTEATIYYQQSLERGGKREARSDVARAQVEVARLRGEVRRLDLFRDVQVAYAETLSAEVQALLAESRLAAARKAEEDIARRVRSARDPLFAGARAETQTSQAMIARDQAVEAARAARAVLASFMGGAADFELDPATFFNVAASPPGLGSGTPPDLLLLQAERDVAAANIRLQQSLSVPDRTVRAGVRYLGQGGDLALVVGGSIPLRRYDRNTAGIERAQSERQAAELDIAAARIARDREIARLVARLAAAAVDADRVAAEVIPNAQRTVDLVREGFNRGGFQYLDVTEAQRALIEARAMRVAILRQYHLDQAALDRLTGRHGRLTGAAFAVEPR